MMKSFSRNMVFATLALLLILGVFAGCKPKEAAASGPVSIMYYTNPVQNEDATKMIAAFEAKYPDINVNFTELPIDTTQKGQTLSTILQSQSSDMDVFNIDCTWPLQYSAAGWLEPLTDLFTAEELKQYIGGPIAANTGHDGVLYSIPQYIDAGILVYRKDLLGKYGFQPPKTWDELTTQAKTIMAGEPNISGFSSAWRQYEGFVCCALEWVWDYGGDVLDNSGNCIINSPEAIAGMKKMQDMILVDKITDPGIMGYMWTDSRNVFNAGNVIFARDWPDAYYDATNPEKSVVTDKVGFTRLPAGPSGSYTTLGGWSFAVSAFSKQKEASKTFIKYAAGYDGLTSLVETRGKLPALAAMYSDQKILDIYPPLEQLNAIAQTSRGRPKTAYYEELSAILQQGFGSVVSGTMTPADAAAWMQPEIQKIMDR